MAVTDDAISKIKQMIQQGELRPGDRLPPEQELSERLGLSRSSMREAVKALEAMRILDGAQVDRPGLRERTRDDGASTRIHGPPRIGAGARAVHLSARVAREDALAGPGGGPSSVDRTDAAIVRAAAAALAAA